MKTKYILHGGYATAVNEENDKFFQEILKSDKKELNILLVLFAEGPEKCEQRIAEVKNQFNSNQSDKILKFIIAESKLLIEQIRNADVIYLNGGKTLRLLSALKEHAYFSDLIKGKTVIGESAGANVLSTCFYSNSLQECFKGLGLVPVKLICHFTEERKGMLKDCPADLEELLLPEYQYKVFEL